ncbi:hypothetical protein SMICM304S_09764 [Streptomyces microflavus]
MTSSSPAPSAPSSTSVLDLAPVVPVVVLHDVADAAPLARALVAGGLPAIEVTLRTPAALESIRAIAAEVPGAVVGAGTVISPQQVRDTVDAGAGRTSRPRRSATAAGSAAAAHGERRCPGGAERAKSAARRLVAAAAEVRVCRHCRRTASGGGGVSPCRSRTKVAAERRGGGPADAAGEAASGAGTAVTGGSALRSTGVDLERVPASAVPPRAAASAARAFALPPPLTGRATVGQRGGVGASSSAVEADASHCRPSRPASIASLASRSACLFCARGIHSYVTEDGGRIAAARAASGFMSGCLIFQRPDICSTTSLESIRTWTRSASPASGNSAFAAVRPAIRPRYSATLLVATPMYSAASARVSPVAASMTTAP